MIDLVDIPAKLLSRQLDDSQVTLRELLGAQSMLIVFLRHANCTFCEMHVARLRRHRSEIGRIVLVSFDGTAENRLHERYDDMPRDWALLLDSRRELYSSIGARRAHTTMRVTVDPRLWGGIVRGAARGARLPRRGADVRQLGADVVVDGTGEVRWTHRSSGPEDRPSIDEVLLAMRDADSRGLRAAA